MISIPITINKHPLIFVIKGSLFLNHFAVTRKRSKKSEVKINGIPSPIEYITRYRAAISVFPLCIARAKIPARIGPIHGVHPAPNATPAKNAPINPLGVFV